MSARVRPQRLSDRIAWVLILWVGSVWLASVLGVLWYVDREINGDFDSEMIESAHRMIDIAVHEYDQAVASDRAPGALPLLGREPLIDYDPVTFQLVDAGGGMLMRSRQAPLQRFGVDLRGGFQDSGRWRVYTVAHPSRPLLLHLADELEERQLHRNRTLLGLIVPMVAVLPMLAWLLLRLARSELRVLGTIAAEVARRGSSDLSPIDLAAMPAELSTVGERVNRLLAQLAQALDTERSFAANAAHELRTPLAAVRLSLQTALDHGLERADVEAALRGLDRLSHRSEKLLQLSRAESAAAAGSASVDLIRLAAAVVDEFWSAGTALGRIDLIADDAGIEPALGDADTLAIALRNLIENALRHAPASRVTVRVEAPATLAVADHGPGVPSSLLHDACRRHARRAGAAAGYGLGLSIVGSIVERHGATLDLQSPRRDATPGFEARIVLQRAAALRPMNAA